MNYVQRLEKADMAKHKTPELHPGDTVKVHLRVIEGNKERIQIFEGTVISLNREGIRKTFTVRKISSGVGVEKIFPVHAPVIKKIQIVKRGAVRRNKLYYLRGLIGKRSRIAEKRSQGEVALDEAATAKESKGEE